MRENFVRLGQLLRSLITASGYRSALAAAGLDKDLDDLASGTRPGSMCDLMMAAEIAWISAIGDDCGSEWQRTVQYVWMQSRNSVQEAVLSVDCTALGGTASELVARHFSNPLVCSAARFTAQMVPGPEMDGWWLRPFRSWVAYAAQLSGVAQETVVANIANYLDADERSLARWQAGESIGLLAPPYRSAVHAAIGKQASARTESRDVGRMAGWLMAAVALQSFQPGLREKWERSYSLQCGQRWSIAGALSELAEKAAAEGDRPIRRKAIPMLQNVEALFSARPFDKAALEAALKEFNALIRSETEEWQLSYQYIYDWFRGRLDAVCGNEAAALSSYAAAVEGAWWRAGPNQHPILNEALLYAVGIGKKTVAEHYWDKTFLLGLNRWPKRPLDIQEMRRLSLGFEHMFEPLKAKERVPPAVEVILADRPFSLTREHLANPNRKAKFAEGRTRRTPFMETICNGTVADVKQILEAGGDLNDYIPESGEGPLIYAMRRACDRKDPAIMQLLLQHEIRPETVNRSASTKRETPLKIALEMADASTVERLIALGANTEAPCGSMHSALCYAMGNLYSSIPRNRTEIQQAYLEGKVPADAYDAKEGAVLDGDLAVRRQRIAALRHASERNEQLFERVMGYMLREPHEHKAVIEALLKCGADPNRRYKVQPGHLAEWTPTLFAAQIGDIDVFKMLVTYGGDTKAQLMQGSLLERYDALWVAVDHKQKAIVDFLTREGSR